ncbi:MAG: class I SAM-dependent methyltransferase [bacterium]
MSRILYHLMKDYVPKDHTRQITPEYYLERLFKRENDLNKVMDLGCGAGDSIDYFRKKMPDIKWIGLDIEKSPAVAARTRTDGEFHTFDGVHIPFANDSFDLIYCYQVFEHVRYPAELLKEVYRVLRPHGYLVGSTSQLEPFHTYSFWNYTPYGFLQLVEEAGLRLVEIAPSIDALTLILRQGFGGPNFFSRWWRKESPLNRVINIIGKLAGKEQAWINAAKLVFCGQFCFWVCKPEAPSPHENSAAVKS